MGKFDIFEEFADDFIPDGVDPTSFLKHEHNLRKNNADRHRRDALNEVGKVALITPEILERREFYKKDYVQAHLDLFPNSTGMRPFGDEQQMAIRRFQRIVQSRQGKLVQAEPRGFAKTSRAVNQLLLAVLQGYVQFGLIVSSEIGKSEDIMEQIQTELMGNDELLKLYPSIFACFHHMEGKPVRAKNQTIDGEFTYIGWSTEMIRFPVIPGEVSSGAIILVRTKDNLRGISKKIRYGPEAGKVIRPDFVLLDDIQTDKDAGSPLLSGKICSNIKRSVLFGGSHSKKMRAIMTITPNKKGDVASHFILREPSWEVALYSMIKKMPTHMDLWDEFGRILLNFDKYREGDRERAQRRASNFVKENFDKLHEGAEVSWENAYEWDTDDPVELSALHHGMIFYYEEGEEAFNYECQCKLDKDADEQDQLKATPEIIASRLSHVPRMKVPVNCLHVVTHVDCNEEFFSYVTIASPQQLYPYIIDYGTYPPQPGDIWKKGKLGNTLAKMYPDIQKEDVSSLLYTGLQDFAKMIANQQYEREDGVMLQNRYIGVDTKWQTDTLVRAIRESSVRAFLLPTQGLFYGHKDKLMMEQSSLDRDLHYLCYTGPSTDRTISMLKIDVNSIKSLVHKGFISRPGTIGSFKLFLPENTSSHQLYTYHLISEDPTQEINSKENRIVTEWHHQKGKDNEWFDNTVGCTALLFKIGCTLKMKSEIKTMNMQEYINLQKNQGK
jgi:Phage terminase large subunit (GpA)